MECCKSHLLITIFSSLANETPYRTSFLLVSSASIRPPSSKQSFKLLSNLDFITKSVFCMTSTFEISWRNLRKYFSMNVRLFLSFSRILYTRVFNILYKIKKCGCMLYSWCLYVIIDKYLYESILVYMCVCENFHWASRRFLICGIWMCNIRQTHTQ